MMSDQPRDTQEEKVEKGFVPPKPPPQTPAPQKQSEQK